MAPAAVGDDRFIVPELVKAIRLRNLLSAKTIPVGGVISTRDSLLRDPGRIPDVSL
jgi:hypothetical protein